MNNLLYIYHYYGHGHVSTKDLIALWIVINLICLPGCLKWLYHKLFSDYSCDDAWVGVSCFFIVVFNIMGIGGCLIALIKYYILP